MTWNHRVVKEVLPDGEEFFSIREVFYNGDKEIYGYTDEPIAVSGESIEALRKTLEWMLGCLDKPVLIDGEVKFAKMEL